MNRPEPFEQQLQQQYQHDKACHVLPKHVRQAVLQQAKGRQRSRWHGLWRNSQLAMSCAFVLLLGYFLLPSTPQAPWQYQIVFGNDAQYRQIQHHVIANEADGDKANAVGKAYQQYLQAEQRNQAFYAQTGLLRTKHDHWQISVCNELLLTIDKQLLSHIHLAADIGLLGQQWVEFISDNSGQLIAIKPASTALQCAKS